MFLVFSIRERSFNLRFRKYEMLEKSLRETNLVLALMLSYNDGPKVRFERETSI